MSKAFDIQYSDPSRLLTIVSFLREGKAENGYYNFCYWDIYHGVISLDTILRDLVDEGIIKELRVESKSYEDEACKKHIKTECIIMSKVTPKNVPKGYVISEYMPSMSNDKWYETNCQALFNIPPKSYVDLYLKKWREEELCHPKRNLFNCRKQIELVASTLLKLLESHSSKHLLIGDEDIGSPQHKCLDLLATLLFLESKGLLILEGYADAEDIELISSSYFSYRLTLTDRFFQIFSKGNKRVAVFDFDVLCQLNKAQKMIECELPYRLYCGDKEYRLNRGGLPYIIMNKAFDGRFIMNVDKALVAAEAKVKGDATLQKGFDNFRQSLRERFNYPVSENFFDVVDGEIRLKPTIFQKKVIKV